MTEKTNVKYKILKGISVLNQGVQITIDQNTKFI